MCAVVGRWSDLELEARAATARGVGLGADDHVGEMLDRVIQMASEAAAASEAASGGASRAVEALQELREAMVSGVTTASEGKERSAAEGEADEGAREGGLSAWGDGQGRRGVHVHPSCLP